MPSKLSARRKSLPSRYFDNEYRQQVILFGTSGRDRTKMAESALTPPAAPNGGTAYAETKLIFECELAEITTFSPDDFFVRKGADFASKGVQGYW